MQWHLYMYSILERLVIDERGARLLMARMQAR